MNSASDQWAVSRAGKRWLREKGVGALAETNLILKSLPLIHLKLNPLSFLKEKSKLVWSKEIPWEASGTRNEMMIKSEEGSVFVFNIKPKASLHTQTYKNVLLFQCKFPRTLVI